MKTRIVASKRDEEDRSPRGSPRLYSQPPAVSVGVKLAVLVALLCQNTSYTLLRRYSMADLKEKYDAQEVLLMGEVFKLVFAVAMTLPDSTPSDASSGPSLTPAAALAKLRYLTARSGKMLALALIYGAMNVLSYVSIRRIDAAVFTVCAQLKILTTAAFSVALLRKQLTGAKWRALTQLVLGCVLVTVPQIKTRATDADSEFDTRAFAVGVAAVVLEVTLSGFASIYFEKVVKTSQEQLSIWDRNFQLALHSILIFLAYSYAERTFFSGEKARAPYRPLHDFSAVAWALALLGGGGGLLVALTVKVADSVVKTLAVSAAIVTSTLSSHFLLDGPLDLPMAIGAGVVALAVMNYTLDATPAPASS